MNKRNSTVLYRKWGKLYFTLSMLHVKAMQNSNNIKPGQNCPKIMKRVINRPDVARATNTPVIQSFSQPFPPKYQNIINHKQ